MSFYLTEKAGVPHYRSTVLDGVPHGFSTRAGGVSRLPHTKSMNLAFGRGDDEETVRQNVRRFAVAIGAEGEHVISLPQIHSTEVFTVTEADCGEGVFTASARQGDGYVSDRHGITLCVKIADCVPILFYAPGSGVIGAVHAGWRGTVGGIAAVCVEKMTALGADVSDIRAAIGPSIGPCCYHVDADFPDAVRAAAGNTLDAFLTPDGDGYRADLWGMNRQILLRAGLSPAHIDVAELCTCCRPEEFFSHRATQGVRGTMGAMIALG